MNYVNHDGIVQVAIAAAFLLVATVTILLRVGLRIAVLKSYGWDDVLISMALCLSIAFNALMVQEVKQGQGLDDSQLSLDDSSALRHTIYFTVPIYLAALMLTKLSILILYLRCFTGRVTRGFTFGFIAIVTIFGFFSVFETIFMCLPISSFWEGVPTRCLNRTAVWVSNGTVVLATDLAILIIPMPALNSLNLPRRQRVELMSVFALGSLACVVSAVRLRQIYISSVTNDLAKGDGPAALLSSLELNVGIICASLPTLRSLVVRTFHAIWPAKSPRPQHVSNDLEMATMDDKPAKSTFLTSNATTEISSIGRTDGLSAVDGILRSVTITTSDEARQIDPIRRMSAAFLGHAAIWDGTQGSSGTRSEISSRV